MIDADTMLYVHDHLVEVDGRPYADPAEPVFDTYEHDPRCTGDCGPCGGVGGVPDSGREGYNEMAITCLYCGGSGRCNGCNFYLRHQARERGLLV